MANKKEDIIHAAMECFYDKGIKFSLQDVADAAECSKTLVIRYFENKEHLLECCYDFVC